MSLTQGRPLSGLLGPSREIPESDPFAQPSILPGASKSDKGVQAGLRKDNNSTTTMTMTDADNRSDTRTISHEGNGWVQFLLFARYNSRGGTAEEQWKVERSLLIVLRSRIYEGRHQSALRLAYQARTYSYDLRLQHVVRPTLKNASCLSDFCPPISLASRPSLD